MKNLIALILLSLPASNVISQPINKIDVYEFPKTIEGEKMLFVTMPFGKSNAILITGDTADLRNAGDIMVDIICTDFPSTQSLSKLNKERINSILRSIPFYKSKIKF